MPAFHSRWHKGRHPAHSKPAGSLVGTPTLPPPPEGTLYFADKLIGGVRRGSQSGYGWLSNTSEVTIDSRNPYPGDTHSLFFLFPAAGGTPEQRFILGQNLTEIYLGWYRYIPNGSEGTGSAAYFHRNGPSSDNNKELRLWDSYAGDPDTSYANERVKTGGSTIPEPTSGGYDNLDINNQIIWRDASGALIRYGDAGWPAPPPFGYSSWTVVGDLGTWMKTQFYAKLESANDAHDGIVQWWKNGTLVFSNTGLAFRDYQDLGNWFKYGYLYGAANSGFDNDTILQVTRFRMASTLALSDPALSTGW